VETAHTPTATVIICSYTEQRWDQLVAAVASARAQSSPPVEVIVSIDHNPALMDRAVTWWTGDEGPVGVRVVANRFAGRLGSARNTAAESATGEILAFLDDDAEARPDWLEVLLAPYADGCAVAVGGAPLPRWERACPKWFPPEFHWVFGCAYLGLPTTLAPVRHLIGANMSVRRSALDAVGGFHSDDHDDMDMCHRVAAAYPDSLILLEPAAVVDHWVGRERTTWTYFWRRCFFVNRGKVGAFRSMGAAGNWTAELDFVRTRVPASARRAVRDLASGDPWGLVRLAALLIGTGLAGAGSISGQISAARADRRSAGPRGRAARRRGRRALRGWVPTGPSGPDRAASPSAKGHRAPRPRRGGAGRKGGATAAGSCGAVEPGG
jgi:glycosyltransferase involved in cell wall biosynthesis